MISFINAKINIGLQIVNKREDGYHDLQTVFYPIGKLSGTIDNEEQFADILEIEESNQLGIIFQTSGREILCAPESNLVYKAAKLCLDKYNSRFENTDEKRVKGFDIWLYKGIPDGAGIGGGSADAAFTLKMAQSILDGLDNKEVDDGGVSLEMVEMAKTLGADCPFFLYNKPMYAEGIGEKLNSIELNLSGYWILLVKPNIYISTKEAFAGIVAKESNFDLRTLPNFPIEEWREMVKNDFETSIFPRHPEMQLIKDILYEEGALYASMSGSGSSIYGIFRTRAEASRARIKFTESPTIEGIYLLEL